MPGLLASKVRARYPGAYDDLDDATLEKQVLAKYPDYQDLVEPDPSVFMPMGEGERAFYDTMRTTEFSNDDLRSMGGMMSGPVGAGSGFLRTAGNLAKAGAQKAGQGVIRTAAGVGDIVSPDVIGMISPRAGKAVELAQRMRGAAKAAPKAASSTPPIASQAPRSTMGRAAQDVAERRVNPSGKLPEGMTERRMDELIKTKFGGTQAPPAKPKLSAQDFTKAHQAEYGATRSAQLRAPRSDVPVKVRAEGIREATGVRGEFPNAAKREIERRLATLTPEEAFAYAAKAPNGPAKTYMGELLRRSLLSQMKSH